MSVEGKIEVGTILQERLRGGSIYIYIVIDIIHPRDLNVMDKASLILSELYREIYSDPKTTPGPLENIPGIDLETLSDNGSTWSII